MHTCGSFSGLMASYWEHLKLHSGCDKNKLKHMEYSSMAHKCRLLSYHQCKRVHSNVRCHMRWPTPSLPSVSTSDRQIQWQSWQGESGRSPDCMHFLTERQTASQDLLEGDLTFSVPLRCTNTRHSLASIVLMQIYTESNKIHLLNWI